MDEYIIETMVQIGLMPTEIAISEIKQNIEKFSKEEIANFIYNISLAFVYLVINNQENDGLNNIQN